MSKKYANIELQIHSQSLLELGQSANYNGSARWNGADKGNVTTIGLNGNASPYGLHDTMGQVYEWTETFDHKFPQLKFIRGGSFMDKSVESLTSIKKFLFNNMLEEGCFGFRVASTNNPLNLPNFVNISGNNIHDSGAYIIDNCDDNYSSNSLTVVDPRTQVNLGSVTYSYSINQYPVNNQEYCEFLNMIDPSGLNTEIYDHRMSTSHVGGISRKNIFENPQPSAYYFVKPNMNNKPVTFIKWKMAAQYCNWLSANKSANINEIYQNTYDLSVEYNNTPVNEWINKGYNKGDVVYDDKEPYICTQSFVYNTGSAINFTVQYTDTELRGANFTSNDFLTEFGGSTVTSEPSPFPEVPDDGDIVLFQNFEDPRNNGIYVLNQVSLDDSPIFGVFKAERLAPYTSGSSIPNNFRISVLSDNLSYVLNQGQTGNSVVGVDNLTFSMPTATSSISPKQWVDSVYASNENRWARFLVRNSGSSYFLPTNNEWHKATFYDSTTETYWKYGTDPLIPPRYIICDASGNAYNMAGYFPPSTKTFPIIITKEQNETPITPKVFTATTSYFSTPVDFQNHIYFINTSISGVVPNTTYYYNYSSALGTDWPAHISPISGSFLATNAGSYNLNSILKFCPLSRYADSDITCVSNLDYDIPNDYLDIVENIAEQGTGILYLQFNASGTDGLHISTITQISGTNLPILPKHDIVDISLLTTSGNNIVVSGHLCDQYVPIVAIAKPANAYTKIGETYSYMFEANDPNVTIIPQSGEFSLSSTTTKITSILKLNNSQNTSLSIKISKPDSSFQNVDYINVICLEKCEPL